ncbi:hypothetical protein BV22DRAFT_1027069, partial [Leucogyrophana mollusca]
HASIRNIIERIFGVLKRRFKILVCPAEYSMDIQARIPPAMCLLHNIIRIYDPSELADMDDIVADNAPGRHGEAATGPANDAARRRAHALRDSIAAAMWEQYNAERQKRGLAVIIEEGL